MNWIKIILFVLALISEGMSKEGAISSVSDKVGVSISDIINRM